MQYSFRAVFVVGALFCLVLALGRLTGYAIGAGIVISLASVVKSRAIKGLGKRSLAVVTGILSFWFLAIDRSEFDWECSDCQEVRHLTQFRIFEFAVSTRTKCPHNDISRALTDLGVPCPHYSITEKHMCRQWGLIYPGFPNRRGISRLGVCTLYDGDAASRLQQVANENPEFPKAFYRRIVHRHDFAYFYPVIRSDHPLENSRNQRE